MTLSEVRSLPNAEIVEWQAFYAVEAQQRELENLKARYGRSGNNR